MSIDNNLWVKNILDTVKEFSSEEYQKRVWIEGKGTEVSSFVEADCFFFDSIPDQLIDIEWRQVGLTEEQKNRLAAFRDALKQFNKKIPNSPRQLEVINHPEWPKIRKLAKEVLVSFEGSKWV